MCCGLRSSTESIIDVPVAGRKHSRRRRSVADPTGSTRYTQRCVTVTIGWRPVEIDERRTRNRKQGPRRH
jgi:hypothetical protein